MFFSGTVLGFGFLGWFGWIFFPRITIAVLATNSYWDTNPVLVVIAWMIAFTSESKEKKALHR
ncbi:MAG TPA: hypothetical protein P5056_00530 [Candidatus Paceibacterota bacterium]|nr:hypothetical protein [Candidatus Paceibacterota bacterium]